MSKLKQKVATLLNNLELTIGNNKLVFCVNDIHCATGSYRSNVNIQVKYMAYMRKIK